jgi:hypothetical protein
MSTRNVNDSVMMFSFFFLQGVLLLVESCFCQLFPYRLIDLKKPQTVQSSNKSDELNLSTTLTPASNPHLVKTVSHQWLPETALSIFLVGCPFIIFTHTPCRLAPNIPSTVIIASMGVITLTSFILNQIEVLQLQQQHTTFVAILFAVLGWLWTLSSVLLTAPLFVIPAMHAFQDLFPHSVLNGPLLKAFS